LLCHLLLAADHVNAYPDWAKKCAVATRDWRNLDIVFP
jgi:hypothetical protein